MARTVGIGIQGVNEITKNNYFYVDKTDFFRECWERGFGRYDVMLEPKDPAQEDAIILEFKVKHQRK